MRLLLLIATVFLFAFTMSPKKQPRILVFTKTSGFVHSCIGDGVKAIEALGKKYKFKCDVTNDSLAFTTENLAKYDAVVFLNTTGNVLGEKEQEAFKAFYSSGKGFVGVHSATDTEYDWPWYNQLVGAYFKSHPAQQEAKLDVKDSRFGATSHLGATWTRFDEWYNFKSTHWDKVNVLLTLDEKSIKGAENGDFHPMAWYQNFDGGRSFYTALGHTEASYKDEKFLLHLYGGIRYAIGKKKAAY